MKLEKPDFDVHEHATRLRELTVLLDQPSHRTVRPCKGCAIPCPCSGSRICGCQCGPSCPHAPAQLSSEGDRYPIEPGIVGLVFALSCLRVCRPYWSCEGHLASDGSIQRLPQVWFYSPSPLYPRLIADAIAQLHFRKRVTHPWHICVTYSEGWWHTGFSLEPDVKMIDRLNLTQLRQDATAIAEALLPDVKALAREHLTRERRTT